MRETILWRRAGGALPFARAGFDRTPGYGLKTSAGFKLIHLKTWLDMEHPGHPWRDAL